MRFLVIFFLAILLLQTVRGDHLRASVSRDLQQFCSSPINLDFSTAGDGTPLNAGDFVSTEWQQAYSLTITAEGNGGGYTPDGKLRVLDSSNPGVAEGLGSPNRNCDPKNRGPGKGAGGNPEEVGENCLPQGNVLIIQDSADMNDPIMDYLEGGLVTFTFDKPTDVVSLGLMDINTSSNWVRCHKETGTVTKRVERLGNNSVQQVMIEETGITKIELFMRNHGGITNLRFCSNMMTDDDKDLGFRFNKLGLEVSGIPEDPPLLPLKAMDYPLSLRTAEWLKQTRAVSVVIEETCGECDIMTHEWIVAIGGLPTHPSANPEHPFWDEMLEVINVQIARINNKPPTDVMPMPKIWSHMDIHQVAEAVHDEFPGVHHIDLLESFIKDGVKVDREIIPSTNSIDFLRGPVVMCDINAWSIGTVGPHNFGVKWYGGRARPEEVAMAIKMGVFPPGSVPERVTNALSQLEFEKATEFTAYPEGSPRHPSWPAMHSAASAGSFWMAAVLELTPEQWCEAKAVDYGVAYARTVAGVHFASDNIAGLDLGQEVLARKLPPFLAARYGSDPVKVKKKIESIRFKWSEYLTSECFPATEDN